MINLVNWKENENGVCHWDEDEAFPVSLVLYRYDGTNCLATVNDEPFALIPRTQMVDLMEAINVIVLN